MKALPWLVIGMTLGWPLLGAAAETTAPAIVAGNQHERDAHWIWSPAPAQNEVPVGDCYFRKAFEAADLESAQIQITADNRFELFVNGQLAARGADWRQMQILDVTRLVRPGRNVVAVRATNTDPGPAGMAARLLIKQKGGAFVGHSTDATWKTSVRRFVDWEQPQFNDRDWVAAASYGALGAALPWGNEVVVAGEGARFVIDKEFAVERLMRDGEVGSLIAMTFDARGNLIVSQEGGPLLLVADSDGNGILDRAATYCDKIDSAQGLLALGTRLFVVGDGPEGPALYRLRDADHDGKAEEVKKLIGFRGSRGEHGPHGLRLGPDGLIYVIVGNFARADGAPAPRSPYRTWYEGDLVRPKYEDAGGHGVGIPAPGGTVFRTDAEGSFVEFFAGGLRNAYDLAFSPDGELFTYDADMEWDHGAPWYRPTRVNHVTAGAEMGWRGGWSKWPEYYLDSLPAAVNVGVGSPTGVEFYDHFMMPAKYRGAMFGCDWATGRIHAFTFQRRGATYVGTNEIFLQGQPLNATDVAVGPDGALYFCTGGRGTDGGVYRIRWTGKPDPRVANLGQGVDRAVRQPQFDADWARARIAGVKKTLGDRWDAELVAVAADARRPLAERQRAIDLMVCFGPRPTAQLLTRLAADPAPELRAKAAHAMSLVDDALHRDALQALLKDSDPLVRRAACESLARRGPLPDAAIVLPLLGDEDRFVAFSARRLLELLPVESWAPAVLRETRVRPFCYGATALVNVERLAATSEAVIVHAQRLLAPAFPSLQGRARGGAAAAIPSAQQLDLLRVIQLALIHGQLGPDSSPKLAAQLLATYPAADPLCNRELVRLLVHLQVDGAAEKFALQLSTEIPDEEKLHIAAYAARLERGWTTASKVKLMQFYEAARAVEGGYSVDKYIENFSRDFLARCTLEEKRQLLAGGVAWPATALSVLATLPKDPSPALLAEVRQLDRRVAPRCAESNAFRRLRVGVIAVLGAADDAASQKYLRTIYRQEPEYRDPVAMSLTQRPDGENWTYLVDSLRTAEPPAAEEIMSALVRVPQRPKEAGPYRHAILLGLRLGDNGAAEALALLKHWNAGASPPPSKGGARTGSATTASNSKTALADWQSWYSQKFPDAPRAELPPDLGRDKWSYDELLTYLESDAGKRGDPARGAAVFASSTAQCAACHRVGARGDAIGPDLTSVGQRFQRKEILESIFYPSHVISDQYSSRVVIANGKSYAGLVTPRGDDGVAVLLPTGQRVELAHADIDSIKPSSASAMPAGLLNSLTLDQVADLFAFLTKPAMTESSGVATRPALRK